MNSGVTGKNKDKCKNNKDKHAFFKYIIYMYMKQRNKKNDLTIEIVLTEIS